MTNSRGFKTGSFTFKGKINRFLSLVIWYGKRILTFSRECVNRNENVSIREQGLTSFFDRFDKIRLDLSTVYLLDILKCKLLIQNL